MAHSSNDYSKIRAFCLELVFFAVDKVLFAHPATYDNERDVEKVTNNGDAILLPLHYFEFANLARQAETEEARGREENEEDKHMKNGEAKHVQPPGRGRKNDKEKQAIKNIKGRTESTASPLR